MDLEDYQIGDEQLEKIVQRVHKVRKKLMPLDDEGEEQFFRGRPSISEHEGKFLDADFQATIEHAMNDEALNEESRIIASFKKGKKLTIEQKIFLVKQKVHLEKTTKAVAALTGVSQSLIHTLAKDYEANPNWMVEMEQKMKEEAHDD